MNIEDACDFGKAVRDARKERGLSQAELARRCGCSQRFVSQVERGKETAELGKALRLLSAMGERVVIGGVAAPIDGRAEVRRAVVRAAETIDRHPSKRRKLEYYLAGVHDGKL